MNVGIITFHGAHNYGAVIQAYALQQYILSLGLNCVIINFRSASQRDFNALYPVRNGIRSYVKNLLMLPYDSKRRVRDGRFEQFINHVLRLTPDLYETEDNLYKLNETIDVFISGSDQVWNTKKKADASGAYFLDFAADDKLKIAYAVSMGNADKGDITGFVDFIDRYTSVSCRDDRSAEIVSELLQREIPLVLDPTLLADNTALSRLAEGIDIKYKDYIFYYSLDGFDKRNNNVEELKALGKRLHKQVVVLTPEWPKAGNHFINVMDAGPAEFLALIKNAALVCTNSFHGTTLSVAFGKDFYVLEEYDGTDDRKKSILRQLGLEERMIKGKDFIKNMEIEPLDYGSVNAQLGILKKKSASFLQEAIYRGVGS